MVESIISISLAENEAFLLEVWRFIGDSKIGPKLLLSLVSLFTVRRLLVTGDMPTVTAVYGFRLAGRISTDA